MSRSWLAVGVLALLGLAGLWALVRGEDGRAATSVEPAHGAGPAQPPAAHTAPTATERGATPVRDAEPAAAPPPPASFPVRGVAYDLDGRALAGIALGCAGDDPAAPPRATTAADGAFAFEAPRAVLRIVAAQPGWTVAAGGGFRHGGPPLRLVLAPAATWSGLVLSAETGEAVGGAQLQAVPPPAPALLALEAYPLQRTQTRADGGFELADVVAHPATRLEVTAPGFLAHVTQPGASAASLAPILLAPGAPATARGTVTTLDGAHAVGAVVQLGASVTRTDPEGRFELRVSQPAPGADLVARFVPYAPARVPGIGARLLQGDVDGLALVLDPRGSSISGSVLDVDGTPLKHWRVEAREPGPDGALVAQTRNTRKDGAFVLEGLGPGPYDLVARGRDADEVAALRDVRAPVAGLVLRRAGAARDVHGVVQDPAGAPIEGARVRLFVPGVTASRTEALTDADGRFLLPDVPDLAAWVEARPAQAGVALPGRADLGAGAGSATGPMVVRLGAARTLRFEALDAARAPDALFPVGADGAPRSAWVGGDARASVPLAAGRSGRFQVGEDARALVLVRHGRELARIAIEPDADGLVRW